MRTQNPRAVAGKIAMALRDTTQLIGKVDGRSDVRPRSFNGHVTTSRIEGSVYQFIIKDVAYRIIERHDQLKPNLFVVLSGRMDLDLSQSHPFQSVCFGTEVAYFRYSEKKQELNHVLGVHYDFDSTSRNHPVFHAQFGDFSDKADVVEQHFRLGASVVSQSKFLIRNVRIPTAQLDFFAVVLQLAADHLLAVAPAHDTLASFVELQGKSAFVRGAATAVPRLSTNDAQECLRGLHWYGTE